MAILESQLNGRIATLLGRVASRWDVHGESRGNRITLVLSAADRAVRPAAGIPWPPPLQTTFARQGSSQTGLVTRES